MKKYNKPVVEINGFEVEDVIAVSIWFSGDADAEELKAVYNDFMDGSTDPTDQALVFEW
jgi:membrane-bound lytic murein transglycosylase MltF